MDIKEIRAKDAPQLAALNSLVSEAFGYGANHRFFDDFPIWESPSSSIVRLGAYEKGVLISHVGIRFAEMKTSKGIVQVALIGAVATDEQHRGKGLVSGLLTEALKRIDKKKCAWSFLWGSEHAFYGKFGFHLQGKQARAPLAKFSLPKGVELSSEVKSGLTDKIFNHIIQEPTGVKITSKDQAWVFAHKTIQWLHLDNPFGYVAYERGMDLRHMIHEFGGDPTVVQTLFYRVYAHDPLVEVMGKPETLEKLGFASEDLIREYLCLARPIDAAQTWNDEFWVAGISAC